MRNTWWRFAPRSQSKARVARERSLRLEASGARRGRGGSSAGSWRRGGCRSGASRRRVMRRMRSAWSRWTSKVARPIFFELLKVGGSSQIRSYCPPASATQRRQSACTRVWGVEGPPVRHAARRRRAVVRLPCVCGVGPRRAGRPGLTPGGEAVGREVPLGPRQVGGREVDGGRRRRPSGEGVHRHRAGVGEEVEEAAAAGQASHQSPREPLVDEEAGVEIGVEVDEVGEVVLADLEAACSGRRGARTAPARAGGGAP